MGPRLPSTWLHSVRRPQKGKFPEIDDTLVFNFELHEEAPECLEPFRYLCASPGKNVRSRLIDSFQTWMKVPEDKLEIIKEVVDLLHNASLLVDDIEDNSKLRRGRPVAHSVYGVPSTLNCANYVYFLAIQKCLELNCSEAVAFLNLELLNLHRGQGRDIIWRDTGICPQSSDYVDMILDKTGGLFRMAVGLMQCFSDNRNDFTDLVNLISIYFQVRDDLINLASPKYHKKKSFCEDFTEGKFSFPIIHGIQTSPDGSELLMNILRQRTEDPDLKKCAVNFLRDTTKSFAHTKTFLKDVQYKIESELESLGGQRDIEMLIKLLSKEIAECEE